MICYGFQLMRICLALFFTIGFCNGIVCGEGNTGKPSIALVPPSPMTEQVRVDLRSAVSNPSEATQTIFWSFSLVSENASLLIESGSASVSPKSLQGVKVPWPAKGHAGKHAIVFSATREDRIESVSCPIEILSSAIRSTKRIEGSWVEFYHWSEEEGKLWNSDIRKLTGEQWKEQVRGMHELGMNIAVIEETVRNQVYYRKHNIPQNGYAGKAYYPSRLYPERMEIAARDPIEAVLSQADELNMHVLMGVGMYAWFDFTPESLEWHKKTASELWERYGHHPSFYGWYISEETPGSLSVYGENTPERTAQYQKEIVSFFRGFREHVHRFAPQKPIMLAPNCHFMKQAETAWRELMQYSDIVCPFGFHRMPESDVSGEEIAAWLQDLCNDVGGHLWMDMEVFLFGSEGELYPRPIDGLVSDLLRFPIFEKIVCYQFPGLLNAPWSTAKPGGDATVKLFQDYKRFRNKSTE